MNGSNMTPEEAVAYFRAEMQSSDKLKKAEADGTNAVLALFFRWVKDNGWLISDLY